MHRCAGKFTNCLKQVGSKGEDSSYSSFPCSKPIAPALSRDTGSTEPAGSFGTSFSAVQTMTKPIRPRSCELQRAQPRFVV